MNEQTFITRIGTWFKRSRRTHYELPSLPVNNEDGAADELARMAESLTVEDPDPSEVRGENNGNGSLTNGIAPAEPRSTFLRPWAKRDAAIENLQSGLGALADLMGGIRDHLEKQSKRQDELLDYLSALPEVLRALPESQRMQGEAMVAQSETLKAIHQQISQQGAHQSKVAEVLERISQADSRNGRALESLNDHYESVRQYDQAISQNLSTVGSAMEGLGRNAEASAQVLHQLKENASQRDGELEKILSRQGTRFTTMLAVCLFLSIAAVAAVSVIGYLGYEALRMAR
jgi:hypothetical protein